MKSIRNKRIICTVINKELIVQDAKYKKRYYKLVFSNPINIEKIDLVDLESIMKNIITLEELK